MKKAALVTFIVLALVSCRPVGEDKAGQAQGGMGTGSVSACCAVNDGVFIHLSSGYDDPHKVLMALKMAEMMSMDKDVLVYVDIKGVDLLLKTSEEMKFRDFPTLHELLDQLAAKKVTVMACPTCLKAAGHDPAELREGVMVAQKDKFFNFTKGRIITLDY